MKRSVIVAICFTASLLLACGKGRSEVGVKPPTPEEIRASWIATADARLASPVLLAAAEEGAAAGQRAYALALLGQLQDTTLLPLFARALRATDPAVRRAAARALGGLPAGAARASSLLAQLLVERDQAVRAQLLESLGRVADQEGFPAMEDGLTDPSAVVREGACRGVLAAAGRGVQPTPGVLAKLAVALAKPDAATPVCAAALSRTKAPEDAGQAAALAETLRTALASESEAVRRFAARGLAEYPTNESRAALAHATEDPDWRVAVQAFRSLAKISSAQALAPLRDAVKRRIARALSPDVSLHGEELHVLLAAMTAAFPVARETSVAALADTAFVALGQQPTNEPLSRDRGLAHCVAAQWVDLARGWPSRLANCGHEQVELWERQVLMAEVLSKVEGADAPRLALLERLAAEPDPRVFQAVLGALPFLAVPEAWGVAVRGLASRKEGTNAAACDALATMARAHPEALAAAPTVARELTATLPRLRRADSLEALQSCLVLAGLSGAAAEDVRALGHHWNRAVASAADAALEAMGQRAVTGAAAPVPNPIAAGAVLPLLGKTVRVEVRTDRGTIVLALDSSLAPTTVARFLSLVDRHFYDGLAFHRVAAGFVVQGGDPGGDGYGGPGWSQRCETNGLRYDEGVVGMALAGRDTGGSQFFITYGPEPHLDGGYTAFGKVVSGMPVVVQLQQGDRMRTIRRLP